MISASIMNYSPHWVLTRTIVCFSRLCCSYHFCAFSPHPTNRTRRLPSWRGHAGKPSRASCSPISGGSNRWCLALPRVEVAATTAAAAGRPLHQIFNPTAAIAPTTTAPPTTKTPTPTTTMVPGLGDAKAQQQQALVVRYYRRPAAPSQQNYYTTVT